MDICRPVALRGLVDLSERALEITYSNRVYAQTSLESG
jgi:hypothetical protein